jgi:hypothetical protein
MHFFCIIKVKLLIIEILADQMFRVAPVLPDPAGMSRGFVDTNLVAIVGCELAPQIAQIARK